MLWSQALQTRSDLSALGAVAPDLAAKLDETRRALDAGALGHLDLPGGAAGVRLDLVGGVFGGGGGGADATDARRRLAERWESLLEEARRLPGFTDFLSAPPFDKLREAARRAGGAGQHDPLARGRARGDRDGRTPDRPALAGPRRRPAARGGAAGRAA